MAAMTKLRKLLPIGLKRVKQGIKITMTNMSKFVTIPNQEGGIQGMFRKILNFYPHFFGILPWSNLSNEHTLETKPISHQISLWSLRSYKYHLHQFWFPFVVPEYEYRNDGPKWLWNARPGYGCGLGCLSWYRIWQGMESAKWWRHWWGCNRV